jgi:hypothetical protein
VGVRGGFVFESYVCDTVNVKNGSDVGAAGSVYRTGVDSHGGSACGQREWSWSYGLHLECTFEVLLGF